MTAPVTSPLGARLSTARVGSAIGSAGTVLFGRRSPVIERIGITLVIVLVLFALVGIVYTPYDPYLSVPTDSLLPPSPAHWLGTDDAGRDILSRLMAGASPTLLAAILVVAVTVSIGVTVAALAALAPRPVDQLVMRACDILLATPGMVLALGIAAALGPSLLSVIVAMVAAGWPATTRFVRGILHERMGAAYVEASRVAGIGKARTMIRHVLPNSLDAVWVNSSMEVAGSIVLIAGLSYLGVGAPAPSADWGSMVSQGREYMSTAWWVATFPGIAITLASIAFGLLGDSLRVRLDPSLRSHR